MNLLLLSSGGVVYTRIDDAEITPRIDATSASEISAVLLLKIILLVRPAITSDAWVFRDT